VSTNAVTVLGAKHLGLENVDNTTDLKINSPVLFFKLALV
jgi:hypothetical protein